MEALLQSFCEITAGEAGKGPAALGFIVLGVLAEWASAVTAGLRGIGLVFAIPTLLVLFGC